MATTTMKRRRASRQRHSAAPYPSASLTLALPETVHPTGTWAADEHDRFLDAMRLYPKGPWKAIADHVATRSVRQVQTHAQKYQEKVVRRMRGLRKPKRKGGDESEDDIGHRVVMGTFGKLRKRRKGDDSTPMEETLTVAVTSVSAASTPMGSAHTDKDSGDDDSDSSSDGSDDESTAKVTPRHEVKICVSASKPSTPAQQQSKSKPTVNQSFSALLEEQSPVGPDCIDLAPLRLSELSPGWFYLDDLNLTDKTMDLANEKESALEGPPGLPSLGESLDFFIEYLSIVIS